MRGPTTPCVECGKATPLAGCWGRNSRGELGELCRGCEPNPFVNPMYVDQAARARRERAAAALDFDYWEAEVSEA